VVKTITDLELSIALDHVAGGAGNELHAKPPKRPKFLAAHSSSALALNCFAPFLGSRPGTFGPHILRAPRLETILTIGGRCGRPNLDLLEATHDGVLAIESKCTEYLKEKKSLAPGDFATLRKRVSGDPYERRMRQLAAGEGVIELYTRLADDPFSFRRLDATQLLKHYLGLRNQYPDLVCDLVYLYWEPENAADLDACITHREELSAIAPLLTDHSIRFTTMTHSTLWVSWATAASDFMREHCRTLRERYSASV
jgi:hypothetical protein